MRQLITIDKSGHIVGEFPHDPLAGFESRRHGLRRRLMNSKEVATMSPESAFRIAQDRYDLEEKRIREKAFIADEKKRQDEYRRKNITVSDASGLWADHLKVTNSAKTIKMYTRSLRLYLEGVGDHRLREFTRDHNIRFLEFLQTVPARPGSDKTLTVDTQHMHIRQLNNFLRWAYDNEFIEKLHRLKKPKLPEREMEVFGLDHLKTLKSHLLTNIDQTAPGRPLVNARNLYRSFMLATNSLMRVGAIYALPLDAIDLDARLIRVRDVPELGWKNKGSKWPNKPISQRLYDFLKEDLANRAPGERWFLDDGYGHTWYSEPSKVSVAMKKQVVAAGLPDGVKPFHWGMRAAMITWLLNDGETPQRVQQLADHADIQTTMRYYNTREAQQRTAVERLPDI